jgi:valyl-tRNA synthetase
MVMLGVYVTGEVPFREILFHGIVNDPYGKKMSKSKGNVVNPLELIEQYGADAVRFALVYGNATGNNQSLSYPKLDAARKFANKLWNMARFLEFSRKATISDEKHELINDLISFAEHKNDKVWSRKIEKWAKEISGYVDQYQFNLAAERLYEFAWHGFADLYIEDVKKRMTTNALRVLEGNFLVLLKLLHPFMPFITEEIYQKLPGHGEALMVESWPTFAKATAGKPS